MAHGLCCHFEESIGENTVLFCPAFQLKKKESYESNSLIFSGTTRNRTMRSSGCISLNWISAKGTVSRGCSTEKPHLFAGFHGVDFLLRCKDNLLFRETNRCPPILLHLEKKSNRRKKDEWQNRIILVVFRRHPEHETRPASPRTCYRRCFELSDAHAFPFPCVYGCAIE